MEGPRDSNEDVDKEGPPDRGSCELCKNLGWFILYLRLSWPP